MLTPCVFEKVNAISPGDFNRLTPLDDMAKSNAWCTQKPGVQKRGRSADGRVRQGLMGGGAVGVDPVPPRRGGCETVCARPGPGITRPLEVQLASALTMCSQGHSDSPVLPLRTGEDRAL